MSIEEKIKVSEGKFAVCYWDPSNPEKSRPGIEKTKTTNRYAIYKSEKYARWYASMRNESYFKEVQERRKAGKPVIGEVEYFVMDYEGNRT